MARLNEQQKVALRFYATGKSMTESARLAGYSINCGHQSIGKLLKREDAQEFMASINKEANTAHILSLRACKEKLSEIVTSPASTPTEAINAINLLLKAGGAYVTKIEADVRHGVGVMVVPMVSTVDEWTKQAAESQRKLMEDAVLIE